MQGEPDIARGFTKCSKEELDNFWQTLSNKLNAVGPPVKCVLEWKKVWNDQKKYVKKKTQGNLIAAQKTGGGPCEQKQLNAIESAISDLIAVQSSVEGVTGGAFGARIPMTPRQQSTIPQTPLRETSIQESLIIQTPLQESPIQQSLAQQTSMQQSSLHQTSIQQTPKVPSKTQSAKILEREVSAQEKMLQNQEETLETQNKIETHLW